MRELFTEWVAGVARVAEGRNAISRKAFQAAEPATSVAKRSVAEGGKGDGATRATLLAEARVADGSVENSRHCKPFPNLPRVPPLPRAQFDDSREAQVLVLRLDLPDALAILDAATRERIAVGYEAGALAWALANLPDLRRRFREAEAAFDALAASPGGPPAASWAEAVESWAALWAELSERYRLPGGAR